MVGPTPCEDPGGVAFAANETAKLPATERGPVPVCSRRQPLRAMVERSGAPMETTAKSSSAPPQARAFAQPTGGTA